MPLYRRCSRQIHKNIAPNLMRILLTECLRVAIYRSIGATVLAFFLFFSFHSRAADEPAQLPVAYLTKEREAPPALSNLDSLIYDSGIQGARLAIEDNNTTGRFTKQNFTLEEVIVPLEGDVVQAFKALAAKGYRHVVVRLSRVDLVRIQALPEAADLLIYDVETHDDALRGEKCSAHVLHLLPSRAMRADALAQYMLKKRWQDWFLVTGPSDNDQLYAAALKRAAKRFGMRIVEEKAWTHTFDARRTAQSDVPVFTQGIDYDILVVADEAGLFGEYLAYRTWLPRPVAGTQGLVPTAWHRTHEQWGAVQLQNRFREQAGRWMTEEDYAAWLAVRAIGEAATRTGSVDYAAIKAYLLGDEFALAGFKGKKLSFRSWNGQLRQPVLLAAPRSLVAVAPLEGFLHPKNELDTLGYDEPETKCRVERPEVSI
jgi:ABC transporter substrate binding protein (PQQ-dependent alcohol dehydrogenase system)